MSSHRAQRSSPATVEITVQCFTFKPLNAFPQQLYNKDKCTATNITTFIPQTYQLDRLADSNVTVFTLMSWVRERYISDYTKKISTARYWLGGGKTVRLMASAVTALAAVNVPWPFSSGCFS
jgi:hypothetical protein